ncbi:MAG TPA: DUF1801 domain-containing protein [Anaerolineae bacterium]|nr:DUF1801 domain-containing protein [Anaerolineae bacterium]
MSNRLHEVDAYLENLEPLRRVALTELRSLVLAEVPDAVATMKYRMPTFELDGRVLCSFASQKYYMSLYMDTTLVEKHRAELAGLDVGKSCIRFRKLEKLPLETVRMILRETVEGLVEG